MLQDNKEYRLQNAVYPALNMYSCPRVSRQKVQNAKIPLLKYREKISANNCQKNYEGDYVDASHCRKFMEKDGMIHIFKKMKKQLPEVKAIKALICVCMYNESKNAINLTLNGIYKNLKYLKRQQGISDGEIAVILIQDGILKLVQDRKLRTFAKGQNSMIEFYKAMDRFEGKPKCMLEERIHTILDEIENYDIKGMSARVARNRDFPPSIQKNIALVYQNLWKPSKTHFSGTEGVTDGQESLRLFSCFKHTNGTKLSSHLWFFQGFCRYFKPQFCVLLDVGTTPNDKGLVNLLRGFSAGHNIGGVTGFMSIDAKFKSQQEDFKESEHNICHRAFFSIEKAQQYEYIIAHFLDKNAESALGFLHVLPGAWSAYRYQALIKSEKYQPNLLQRSYFKMILNPDIQEQDFQEANMYLAEDRILSLGIYCQMDSKYILKYVPDAIAYTDPMKDHQNLMNQRRRWINSSLFAFLYVFRNYYFNVMDSNHNCCRKYITLNLSMIIALLGLFFSYIAPALYFFILYSTIYQMGFAGSVFVGKFVALLYILVFIAAVGGSLRGKQWSKHAYIISIFFAIFNVLIFFTVIWNIILTYFVFIKNPIIDLPQNQEPPFDPDNFTSNFKIMAVLVTAAVTIGSFVIILLVHLPSHGKFVCRLLLDTPSYFFYTGAYAQTMVIHGFCNVDDVTWGTKGVAGHGGANKYEVSKVFFVSSWLFYNAVLGFIFIYIDIISLQNGTNARGGYILLGIAIFAASLLFIKFILALIYHLKWMCTEWCCLRMQESQQGEERVAKIYQFWKNQHRNWVQNYQNRDDESVIYKKGKKK